MLRLLSWLTTGIVASFETMGYKFRRWSCKQCRYCGQPFYGPADHFACLPCFRDNKRSIALERAATRIIETGERLPKASQRKLTRKILG